MVSYQNQNIRCFIYIVYVIQLNILKRYQEQRYYANSPMRFMKPLSVNKLIRSLFILGR